MQADLFVKIFLFMNEQGSFHKEKTKDFKNGAKNE